MMRRITTALIIGAIVATCLELLNGFFAWEIPPLVVITPLCLIVALIAGLFLQRGYAPRTLSSSVAWSFGAILFFFVLSGTIALLTSPETAWFGVSAASVIVIACGSSARTVRRRRGRVILAYVAQAVQMNLPFSTILNAAAKSETKAVARRIDRLRTALEGGSPVGDAVASAVPQVPQRIVDLANTAERNGRLPQVLGGLLDDHYPVGCKYKSVGFYSSYSLLLLLAISAVITLLTIFIMPRFEQIFMDFKTPLPPVTQNVMVIGQVFAPAVCLVAVIVTLFAEGRALRQLFSRAHPRANPLRHPFDYVLWYLPVIGTMVRNRDLADVCGVIAGGVDAGRPVEQAIFEAVQPHLNAVLRRRINSWAQLVSSGIPLADSASRAGLPSLIGGLTGPAVRAGNLPSALRFLARHYESSFSRSAALLQAAAVPAIVLTLGAAVMCVALALFEPMVMLIQTATIYTRYW
jgi:type II secretory pathway component PulF